MSLERAEKIPELIVITDRVLELRSQEMDTLTLSMNEGIVDLYHLHLTAYGYKILKALGMGVTCTEKEFKKTSKTLKKLGFSLEVKEKSNQDEFVLPTNISGSLAEYIIQLIKSRT